MNGGTAVHRKRSSGFFIAYVNGGLPFHHGQVPIQCALETGFVEHYGMQCLRQAAHFFQSALCDFADLAQLGSQFRAFWRLIAGSTQHSANPVKICPNSSCSSREMWRSVDSWVEISFCASSLRCSESVARRANSCRFERIK